MNWMLTAGPVKSVLGCSIEQERVRLVLQKQSRLLLVAFTAAALAIASGCSKPAPDTKAPVSSAIGIIDMAKVIKSHPKYTELDRFHKQMNNLVAEIEQRSISPQPAGVAGALSGSAEQGLANAMEQEFNAQMAQKQTEIESRLNVKADQIKGELSAAMRVHVAEVDQEYQPRIFSLQLKLKTVQLAKEEAEKIQKEIEALQAERYSKLAPKEQELAVELQARMLPLQTAAREELSAYAQELNARNQKVYAQKAAELSSRASLALASEPAIAGLEQQAAMKKQEIAALEEYIIKDIRDKAAKVAAEKKLDTVLASIRMNIQAVDISDAVIAEFKK